MKKLLAILVCKLARLAGKLLGKGSSLPGKLALKICPDILSRISLPPYVVAVTGSNGKTSTVEMIAHILQQNGKRVAYNKEGSNQIEGVATFLLTAASLGGKVKADVVLLESDERFARHTFRHFRPTHYVILNLYRDQLTRNGHPQWMYHIVGQSVYPESKLILNADDPLVSRFGLNRENTVYFGIEQQEGETAAPQGAYDDGALCPNCLRPMAYDFRHYNHIGSYSCPNCGLKRHKPDYSATYFDLSSGTLTVEEEPLPLSFHSLYQCYNTLAAYALCRELGLEKASISKALRSFSSHAGRVVEFTLGEKTGTLLTSKHENSVSYDQSLRYVIQKQEKATVVVLVDAISRKYFTSETSWLWDVDFDLLAAEQVEQVWLVGKYCHDLAVRVSATCVSGSKMVVREDISGAVEELKGAAEGHIFVVTCFSDKDKLLGLVEVAK